MEKNIPILIIPCIDARNIMDNIYENIIDQTNKYRNKFIKHIITCQQCEITNNGILFPTNDIFNNCLIGKVYENKIKKEMNAYHTLTSYIDDKHMFHNILYIINDENSNYNKCYLFVWNKTINV
jgi:hypothetical protein